MIVNNGKPVPPKAIGVAIGIAVVCLMLAVLIGMAFGSRGNHAVTAAAISTPAPTVTVTAEPEVQTVGMVPQSCLDAIDAADEGFSIAADVIGKYSDGVQQIVNGQYDEADSTIDDINGLSSQLDTVTPKYVNNKEACRSAAQ